MQASYSWVAGKVQNETLKRDLGLERGRGILLQRYRDCAEFLSCLRSNIGNFSAHKGNNYGSRLSRIQSHVKPDWAAKALSCNSGAHSHARDQPSPKAKGVEGGSGILLPKYWDCASMGQIIFRCANYTYPFVAIDFWKDTKWISSSFQNATKE